MGLLRPDPLRRRARLLPPAPAARQDPSSSAARARQSTRRDPSWLPGSPSDLSRGHRLAELANRCRLTFYSRGMSRAGALVKSALQAAQGQTELFRIQTEL